MAASGDRRRLIDILSLIENASKSQEPVATVEQHKMLACWESVLRGLPGMVFNKDDGERVVWLEIERLVPSSAPQCVESLEPWLVSSDDPEVAPSLKQKIVVKVKRADSKARLQILANPESREADIPASDLDSLVDEEVSLEERPEVQDIFQNYLNNQWTPWADGERPRRASIKVYSQFFELQRKMELETSSDQTELVWGMAVALGKINDQAIKYPLITAPVFLTIDEASNSILVQPREVAPLLDSLIYERLEIPGVKDLITRFKEWLEKERPILSPFSPDSFIDIARTAVAYLSDAGIFWPDSNPNSNDRGLPELNHQFLVTDSWVIFARKKSTHAFTEDVRRLREHVEELTELEGGPRALVADPTDDLRQDISRFYRGVWGIIKSSFGGDKTTQEDPEELYFPKPYNSEQLDIIDRLNVSDGVVVQGPPGTGKTHTIANIICHYLAHGKRVLVTSSGEAALRVLRDKLPEGIKTLVVSQLQDERDGAKQLERSIKHIAGEVAGASLESLRLEIRNLEKTIDSLHLSLRSYETQMREWATEQVAPVPGDAESRTPIDVAKLVYEQHMRWSWFPDAIGITNKFEPSFSEKDVDQLRAARAKLGSDLAFIHDILPSASSLPDASVVSVLHNDLSSLADLNAQSKARSALLMTSLEPKVIEKAEGLLRDVNALLILLDKFASADPVAKNILGELQNRTSGVVATELLKIRAEVMRLESLRLSRLTSKVEIPEGAEADADFVTSVGRLAAGKKAGGVLQQALSSSLRAALKHVKGVTLNTKEVSGVEDWKRVQEEIEFFDSIRQVAVLWNNVTSEVGAEQVVGGRYDCLRLLLSRTAVVEDAYRLSPLSEERLKSTCLEVFKNASDLTGSLFRQEVLLKIRDSLQLGLPHQRRAAIDQRLGDLVARFSGCQGTIVKEAVAFLTQQVGRANIDADLIEKDWDRIISILRTRENQRPLFVEVKRVAELFESSGAPVFARMIAEQAAVGDEDPLLPPNFLEVWKLRRLATYLEEIDCHFRLRTLMKEREAAERRLGHAYEELVRCRVWLELRRRLTGRVSSSLQAFMSAIKSLGKGTGVRANRHRAEARHAMEQAWEAVPCWIMSTHRVAEVLPSRLGLFDLVIIDEASQSYLEAMPALVRGKKILVVGDDEQISPTSFMAEADVTRYRDKYLSELPKNFQAQLAPGKSIYDFARVVFPSGQVTLREHFRCVSAIIEFSNSLCYDGKIQSLRVPKPSERLDPPLVDIFVLNAWRSGKVNQAEAEVIAQEIERISKTPGMERRSIGVISLIGSEQAKVINDLLMERLGEDLIRRHDIVCGDSYTLQGNERDIVFLSMISTPEDARMETSRPFKQRFNVATSRARDRMYLVRSVRREDLKDGDLKARLLDHFRSPLPEQERGVLDLRELCDSAFEQAVFDELVRRKYSVTPQVQSSGYRIDMVVEGSNDARLAVECDGDAYHGPEAWADDFKRQRVLERAGWKFWRCWGSSFYRDPRGCIEDLIQTLDEMGIKPREDVGISTTSSFVEYREVDPFAPVKETERPHDEKNDLGLRRESIDTKEELPTAAITATPRQRGRVDLDEIVEYYLEDDPSQVRSLRVVELGVTNLEQGIIESRSSLGSVLLGSQVNDTFEVSINGRQRTARISRIHDIDDDEIPATTQNTDKEERSTARGSGMASDLGLAPYIGWKSRPLIDPRGAKRGEILEGLLEIVSAEGPVTCLRAFSLYARAAGFQRLGVDIKDALFRGLQAGINKGAIEATNEMRRKDRLHNTLSIPGHRLERARAAGDRAFDEIPLTELALLLKQVISLKGGGGDRAAIHREVVRLMGGSRVAATARERLISAESILEHVALF